MTLMHDRELRKIAKDLQGLEVMFESLESTALNKRAASEPALRQYIHTALWSSADENGSPLDMSFSEHGLAPKAKQKMQSELSAFLAKVREAFPDHNFKETDLAHDFWLTRNRHGSGFWDHYKKPWDDAAMAKKLTDIAQSFGEQDLVVGDDGQLYAEP